MTEMQQILENAWSKIQVYCKQKYTGVACRDINCEYKNGLYAWGDFGVTPEGDAYFSTANWSISRRSDKADWYYHPGYRMGFEGTRYREMEMIIRNWPTIKEKLEKAFAAYKAMVEFEA